MTLHLRPTAALAKRALLPEDPGAAMALAQALLDRPLMFNHSHGLWGYTGKAADGRPLTVQSTGIGGPSAAVVLTELIAHGLRRAIRVGTCAGLGGELALGELVIASAAPTAAGPAKADAALTAGLALAGPGVRSGPVVSTDCFYGPGGEERWAGGDGGRAWGAQGALAVDLESATLLGLGARAGVAVGCVLVVADRLDPPARIGDDELTAALERAGRLALAALGRALA